MSITSGNNWLLNIAINEYKDSTISNLQNPILDAERFETVLKEYYGFSDERTIQRFNEEATRGSIIDAFDELVEKLGEKDNLIIYFAGHGRLDKKRDRGFWQPFDTKPGRSATEIRNETIITYLKDFPCKHILLISDSCFSGSFFGTDRDVMTVLDPQKAFDESSRWAITSGRKQKVSDGQAGKGSPFSKYLIEKLEKNTDSLLLTELGNFVVESTFSHTETYQTPVSDALRIRGHKGGQFIFKRIKKVKTKITSDPLQKDVSTWNKAKLTHTQAAYKAYLKSFPEGEFVEVAESRIAQLSAISQKDKDIAAWKTAKQQDNLEGYQAYVREFPEGAFVLAAEKKLERRRKAVNQIKEEQHRKEKLEAYIEEGETLFLEKDYEGAIQCWEEALALAQEAEKGDIEKNIKEAKEQLIPKTHPLLKELGIEMIQIEGGTFMMGSERGRENEQPVHKVILGDYYLAKTPITQLQWEKVMGTNPSHFKRSPNCPVENISWNDAQKFCQKLSQQTDQKFSLPTEAQWEFAARGGNLSKGYTYAGSNVLEQVGWYWQNAGDKRLYGEWDYDKLMKYNAKPRTVALKKANELGLNDMSGNVWEWCADWFGEYSSVKQTNPSGPGKGEKRVIRGGSWVGYDFTCGVAFRYSNQPSVREEAIGFRLAMS